MVILTKEERLKMLAKISPAQKKATEQSIKKEAMDEQLRKNAGLPPVVNEALPTKNLTKAQKTALIKKIPHNVYTDTEINKLVDDIRENKVFSLGYFPTPTEGGDKVELEFTTKEKKTKLVEPEPVKEVKPLSKATIKANADRAKKKLKEAEAKKKADAKEAKRLKNIKPYYKADDPPKGFREATPIEAIKEKKVMLYGKKKVDSKLIDSMFKPTANSKDMILDLTLKIASKVPKLKNLKAVIDGMEGDERYDSTDKKAEFSKLRAEILALSEKKKKLEAKQK